MSYHLVSSQDVLDRLERNGDLPEGMRPLGKNQFQILRNIAAEQYPGGGWHWGSNSETTRILDGLVERGLVRKTFGTRNRYVYTAAPALAKAFAELAQESREADSAHRARVQAERAAIEQARATYLATVKSLLSDALNVLERGPEYRDRISVNPEQVALARAYVAGLTLSSVPAQPPTLVTT